MIEVEKMRYHTGWSAEVGLGGKREAEFKLWAPDENQEKWAACWGTWEAEDVDDDHSQIIDGTEDGNFLYGDTMEDALAVLDSYPDADLAARVRRLLSGAARDHAASTEPNGDN